jgi:hypothetical protein
MLGGVLAWAYTHRDDMKQFALTQINKQLKANIKVQSIRMDVFRNFPQASLNFEGVWIEDANKSMFPLIEANRISLGFNLMALIRKDYTIRQIYISDARLQAQTDKNGKHNYQIFTTTDDTSTALFDLKKITCKDVTVVYQNAVTNQQYDLHLLDATLGIKAQGELLDMKLDGELMVNKLLANKIHWIKNKKLTIKTTFVYDGKQQTYQCSIPTLRIGGLLMQGTLFYRLEKKGDYIDLQFAAERSDVTGLLSLLPIKLDFEKDWKGEGLLKLDGVVKGNIGAAVFPDIAINFDIANGGLIQRSSKAQLSDISAKGAYRFKQGHTDLQIQQCTFAMPNSTFQGNLSMVGKSDPTLMAQFVFEADARDLMQWIGEQKILKNASGNIQGDLQINAPLSQLQKPATLAAKGVQGNIKWHMEQVKMPLYNHVIDRITGSANIGKHIALSNVVMQSQGVETKLTGTLNQLAAWILDKDHLTANLQIESQNIVLTDWLFDTKNSPDMNNEDKKHQVRIFADVKTAAMAYDKVRATDVWAEVAIDEKNTEINIKKMQAFGGSVSGTTTIVEAASGYAMQHTLQSVNVHLKTLFEQCNDFYQDELTHKHLSGIITANLSMNANWDKKWNCDLSSIAAVIDVKIKDGGIKDYKPLLSLSRFADVEDLKDIRFAELLNTIFIKNSIITIPEMQLQNNALNVGLSGSQSFDGKLDYRFKIKLSELLRKKRNKPLNEFEEHDESGKGMYLYLLMTGTTDNPQIGYDKSGAKKKAKQDLKAEKETIKEVLRKEFGVEKSKAIKEKQNDNNELEFEIE